MAKIELKSLRKRFADVEAVKGVSLAIPKGAFLVLVGPSGCGKSTILRMLAGLEAPTSGQIIFDGKVVSDGDASIMVDPARRGVGLVFQSYALWPHMMVRTNVDWPLRVAKWPAAKRRQRVDEVLGLLAIAELSERYPSEISGGQQQRVAIARMIAPNPGILLFDEPLSNLDAKLRVEMRSELMRLHRSTGATVVYVTHDQIEATTMASHVAVLNAGRLEQFAAPAELISDPATVFVATFVGTPPANIVPVVPTDAGCLIAGQRFSSPHLPKEAAFAMYRPQTIRVSAECEPGALPMQVAEINEIAGRWLVTATAGDRRMTAIVDRRPRLEPAETLHMILPAEPAALFRATGERIR